MNHDVSLLTYFLNKLTHNNLPDNAVMAVFVFILAVLIFIVLRKKPELIPSPTQQIYEGILNSLNSMLESNMGKDGKKFLPFVTTIGIFIFFSNVLGLVPGFTSTTANLNTTAACAIIVFLYYNYHGIKENGFGYLKHFIGPMPALAPLMIPIEIISHIARPFSLAIRLFVNMFGDHIVLGVFVGLIPFILPIPLMALGLFVCFIQTLIFVILTIIYLSGAVAHDH